MNYEDREYEWKIGHETSASGNDEGYSIARRVNGFGSVWGEMTRWHLEQLADELNYALWKIKMGDL